MRLKMSGSLRWLPIALGLFLAAPVAISLAADDTAPAARPTFYKDVLPIFQKNCQECHRPSGANFVGMVAPFSLMEYDEVRPWAKAIARNVGDRTMPPWFASKEFDGVFELERKLTDEEIATIVRWSQSGAGAGNPSDAPAPRVFPSPESGWVYGEPDLILNLPEPYWVADDVDDVQPRFYQVLTEEQLPEDRWVNWIEFRPGSEIVHHGGVSVQALNPDGSVWNDPFSGGKLIGTAPGDGPDVWPLGYGKLIRKGSQIRWGIHYHKEPGPGTGLWDISQIAIKWHDKPVKHIVRAAAISSRGWEIPPQNNDWKIGAQKTFDQDTYLINFMPHMHFRGKSAKWDAFYPDGTVETLLDVPAWDYNWQRTYTFRDPKFIPAGTRLEVTMVFDNSSDNQWVPNPNRGVYGGPRTQDEMNIGWTEYANAAPIEDVFNSSIKDEKVVSSAEALFDDDLFRPLTAQKQEKKEKTEARTETSAAAAQPAPNTTTRRRRRGPARQEAKLGEEGKQIRVLFPETTTDSLEFKRIESASEGDVIYLARNTSVKLLTDLDLRFGDTLIKAGNATEGIEGHYPGVYSLWLKKQADGWALVLSHQADVMGSQYDPSHDAALIPLNRSELAESVDKLSVQLEERSEGGLLKITWGKQELQVPFEIEG